MISSLPAALTDSQLRASAVPIIVSAALPAGSNAIGSVGIVGALPTGTNAIGFVSIGAALPAGGNVIGAVSQSGTWTVTGPLTDAQLRASPAPVTGAAPNVATGQVTCGTSATLIVDARSTRRRVTIICHSAANLFIGISGVTTGTGLFMPQSVPMIFDTTAAIYGDSASSSVVSYLEVYD